MVTMWAENEARNWQRLARGGVKCPGRVSVRGNVVVMELVGVGESPVPRLKDAPLTPREYRTCYMDLLKTVWKMYNRCALMHADLSEYNILYHDAHPYTIDVSQSAAPDHSHAWNF
ncbi:hypothetical protein M427DRAFT_341048 [Gonapodya prolifera JEL478]|uniref:non-specific serine/threonine protein kinase n=1 Tax=Gonapodya prolifera (strain JEL478) TaxID=1344416 RepID=A0A139AC27_GONPJ|nr:hypothetical protein M427DRAFT_341048 [Gonapodya prolifera JEL478]|eukprot:KXS14382.1 hypothetical protein M427DRAFT_341048 [Gonapodya prolifera JEL478]